MNYSLQIFVGRLTVASLSPRMTKVF